MLYFLITCLLLVIGALVLALYRLRAGSDEREEQRSQAVHDRQRALDFMHLMAEALGEGLSRQELHQRIVHASILCTGALSACIFERTPNNMMRSVAVEGLFPPHRPLADHVKAKLTTRAKFIEQVLRSEEFPVGEGIAGRVAETGRGELVADAVARVGAQVPFDVLRVVDAAELDALDAVAGVHPIALGALAEYLDTERRLGRTGLAAVVASQGHYDEETLEALLAAEPAFLGLVASRRRAADGAAVLASRGVAAERIATIRAPAGLDLGARTPGEVAISIFAEIVEATAAASAAGEPIETTARIGIDPVCGMEVALDGARYHLERDGRSYVFCGPGCQAAFVPA